MDSKIKKKKEGKEKIIRCKHIFIITRKMIRQEWINNLHY